MNSAADDRQLGEYRLTQLLAETPLTRTWLAEQISVARKVLVDELRADRADQRNAFLADVRAKASVDHPLIGSVYEAVAEPGLCFYAHELLPGVTLAEREQTGPAFRPAQLADILRRVAEAHLQHETLGHATSPLDLDAVHLDEHGVIRLKNLAIAGRRTPDLSERDIVRLGNVLVPLVAQGQPGSTRMLTLFGWMRGEELEAPINWAQTRDFCVQIEHQLADPLSLLSPSRDASPFLKKFSVLLIAAGTAVLLLGIGTFAVKMREPAPKPAPRVSLPGPVSVPAGTYPTPDGAQAPLPAFRISAHEITIGQYADFLETLGMLAKDQRQRTFDLAGQPPEKTSHEPADWPALLAAAKTGGTWQDQPVTLDSPVVGIDWWDAATYAEWKKARLPTQEEWFAALSADVKSPAAIPPGPWAPVTSQVADRTPTGLLGMAGSVCEWTSGLATNPANPLGDRRWVIIGGSHLKPGSNALSREWTFDRSLRRPD
ncbi:SUMF1/EgtB/PvdO family nonheme iron enzyme, partial [bacterium]|nr:SUMF1/EgtB/PvdO family nonheme iron enzyme [bacterium]